MNKRGRYRTGTQGTFLSRHSFSEGESPHKPFDLEPLGIQFLDLEFETERLEAEMLRAERFTPPDKLGIFDMPGIVPANQSYILLTIGTHHDMFII